MKIYKVKDRTQTLIKELTSVWEASVRATHDFLTDDAVLHFKKQVPIGLLHVPILVIAKVDNIPVGFMGIDNDNLNMLFISPDYIGKGIGRKLIEHSLSKYSIKEVQVNEQNPAARGFYEHLGFKVYRRSDTDEQGNPYPLLYMKLN